MKTSRLLDDIISEREYKNERILSIVRLTLSSTASFLDFLAYFQWIEYTITVPTFTTLFLDSVFFGFSLLTWILFHYRLHFKYIKFLTITLDYSIILLFLVLDPTVPREGGSIYWSGFVASIFLYSLNLLRYSKVGTIYSGFLSIVILLLVGFVFNPGNFSEILPMFINLLMILLIGYLITTTNRKMMEEANAKQMMERYLPPQLINELYRDNASLLPGGVDQEVTILFSDIRSFTGISESLSAKEVVSLLNQYLSLMTEIIFRNNGTIDKFIGDAIMTIFGAPKREDDDALRAIHTAIEMQIAMHGFNESVYKNETKLKIGIGIHTGEVVVGNIGSDKRVDYTVIGDNVNLSSRIEGMTKYYNCPILISEATYQKISKHEDLRFLIREVDRVVVKGKSKPIRIYEVMFFQNSDEKEKKLRIRTNYELALNLYYEMKFEKALEFLPVLKDDPVSEILIQRCKNYTINRPAENWEGVFYMDQK